MPRETKDKGSVPLHILYLGSESGTSKHRADALTRLGHEVTLVSPYSIVQGWFPARFHALTGHLLTDEPVRRSVAGPDSGQAL